jgi:hypothetical protein
VVCLPKVIRNVDQVALLMPENADNLAPRRHAHVVAGVPGPTSRFT